MNRQFGIGIIGCGHITAAHLNSLKELKEKGLLSNTRVVALCDRDRTRAESFLARGVGPEQKSGVGPKEDPMQAPSVWVSDFQEGPAPAVYEDYRELLERMDVNAVLVLSSVFTHHEIGFAAIRAGKNILIEKPLAISVKAARLLVDAAKKAGVSFGVAEQWRYTPTARMARWAVDAGHLGTPQMSIFVAAAGYWAPNRIVAETAWRHKKVLAAGGVAVDWMVHSFHQLRYVFGEIAEVAGMASIVEPTRSSRDAKGVVGEIVNVEIDDTLSCSLRYANGAAGSVFVTWAGHGEKLDIAPTFYGSKGSIRGDRLTLDERASIPLADFFHENADASLKDRLFPKGITNPFTLEMFDFLSAAQNGSRMETSGEEGLLDLAVCFASLESSLTGRNIRLCEILSGRAARYERPINAHYAI
jgi:1,5-anhydro-D-fructose reductase (1,5-anhydro-D-mannitol-forming)